MDLRYCLPVLAAAVFAGSVAAETTAPAARPNIIVIISDDHGYADLGVQGAKDIKTPHLDSLAANGIWFTSGYVTCPVCSPTRAGLLTGRYQTRFGHEFNPGPNPDPNYGLPTSEKTIANYLKEAGYATAAVGKWHLGYRDECMPTRRGFDQFYGFLGGAHQYNPKGLEPGPNAIRRDDTPVSETRYLTHVFSDEAVQFIDKNHEKPFFLYLAYNAIHTPMDRDESLVGRFPNITDKKRLSMATMLGALDDGVGRVLETLRKHKLEENTLIVFHADNGGPTPGNASLNTPLNGHKGSVLEGGIRVPFIVQWAGKLPKGKVYEKPVVSLDVLPTALAAAGVTPASGAKLDGKNLLPYLRDEMKDAPHDRLFWRFGPQAAARVGDWKLIKRGAEPPKLFNLAADISESKDLAAENPDKLKELQAAYDAWNKENIPGLWRDSRAAKRADKGKSEIKGMESEGAAAAVSPEKSKADRKKDKSQDPGRKGKKNRRNRT